MDDDVGVSSRPHRIPLFEVAKLQSYEPLANETACPALKEEQQVGGDFDISGPNRAWRSQPHFLARFLHMPTLAHRSDKASPLGNRVVSGDFKWAGFEIEPVPIPNGYHEWAAKVLTNHSSLLKGNEPGKDYIYGAIFCSLGKYSISPSVVRATLERWDYTVNTFVFPFGERTITLLDMKNMAGLPLEGEPYEEFIPPQAHMEPAMLLYPKTLLPLHKAWRKLEHGGKVTFQQWCDHFHYTPENFSGLDSNESSNIYTAAFLALWICCFAIVGGGPYIRPGVLVIASWITVGRRFALAQPSLCSLYYSLRLISTKLVNPTSLRRLWPVHYLIGWIGDHIPAVLDEKMKNVGIPICPYPSVRPTMLNTMSRMLILFNPREAHQLLCRDKNILWNPYKTRPISPWTSKIFDLSFHRGLLPWRIATHKSDFCVLEPYHPERVARQFGLDQVIPHLPLTSLVTESKVGIAYAHWQHLLRPIHENSHLIPDASRVGRTTLTWVRWFTDFIKPFNSILRSLGRDYLYEPVHFGAIQCNYHAHPGLASRNLSSRDLAVVREVPDEHRPDYRRSITDKEAVNNNYWKRVLHNLLGVQVDFSGQTAMMRSNFEMEAAAGSSLQPILLDNLPAKENLIDNHVVISAENNKKRSLPVNTHTNDGEDPPAKRKLDFSDMDEDCSSTIAPIPNITIDDENLNQSPSGTRHLEDEDSDASMNFSIKKRGGNSQPLPFIENYGTTAGSSEDFSKSPYNMTHVVLPDIESTEISVFINDLGQRPDHPISSQARSEETLIMDTTEIEKMFLMTTYQVVQKALDGLDVTTLKEPERCASLQITSASLPVNFASISKIKVTLDKLVTISQQLQLAHSEFEESSGQIDQAISGVKQELSARKDALQITVQEVVLVGKKKSEVSAELAKLNIALKELEDKEKQLLKIQSDQDLKVKEQEQALCDATVKVTTRVNDDLQAKITVPVKEAEKLFADLNQFLPNAN